jgi:GTPase SAR1 family protein
MDLSQIRRVKQDKPPRLVIYGPPGVGKTSLAAEFPSPIFIQTEDGVSSGLEFDAFPRPSGWFDVYDALKSLADPGHDYRTIVIDSIDKLEPLIWQQVCDNNGWDSIESPGYGKGYVEADALWYKLFHCLDYLRDYFSMGVILIAHSTIVNYPNPTGAEFPRWDIRLQKRAHGIVEDSVDAILMVDYDSATKEEKGRGGSKVAKSTNSTLRWIHCQGSPARNAKNRYGMPDKVLYNQGAAYATLSEYFPASSVE